MKDLSNRYSGMSLTDEKTKRSIALGSNGLIKFGGSEGFDEEDKTEQNYTVSLINHGNASKRIVLFPGELANTTEIAAIAGITADAIATNGNVIMAGDVVVIECIAANLAFLQRFLKRNPTRVVEMQITGATKSQLSQPITVTKVSPYAKLGAKSMIPNQYRKASDSDTLMAKIDVTTLQLDDQTVLDVVVAPNSGIDITFFFGASRNDAYTLNEQAKIALG
ncbi:MAG: hypothetical protein EOL95_09805 [Bacteroidia bacterium]|nr:hypothetical protein [Bacteroidia bacterium]